METEKAKMIHIFKKLGSHLGEKSVWFLKKAFNVRATRVPLITIQNLINQTFPVVPYFADRFYFLTKWKVWKNYFEYEWTNHKKYLVDKYDCDNFANSFASRAAEILELNTAGTMVVQLINPDTGKHIGYHRCNIIVAYDDNNILRLYAYDAMTGMQDKWCLIEKGKPIIIKNWKYIPYRLEFA